MEIYRTMEIYKVKTEGGEMLLYPVGDCKECLDKFVEYYDLAALRYAMFNTEENERSFNEVSEIMKWTDKYIINGVMYAPFEIYVKMLAVLLSYKNFEEFLQNL